jgi:hypothetical protein
MALSELRTGTFNLINHCNAVSGGIQWFTEIICHLRDDLATDNLVQALPQNGDIRNWVTESFYPGLAELTWEEAVLSLLSRMQHYGSRLQTEFAEIAMQQLQRATRNSQIWHM